MFQNFLHFLKYHNAVSIAAVFLIVASGSFAASPDLRNSVVSSQERIISVDNRLILLVDMIQFNPHLQIDSITEDPEWFYVVYHYDTLGIRDSVWQDIIEQKTLRVAKALLGKEDLGLYVAKELGEVLDYQRSYLTEVQTKERTNGATEKVAVVEYQGLIGKFLSPDKKIFPGYEQVVKETASVIPSTSQSQEANESTVASTPQTLTLAPAPAPQLSQDETRALIKQMVEEALRSALAQSATTTPVTIPTTLPSPEPAPTPTPPSIPPPAPSDTAPISPASATPEATSSPDTTSSTTPDVLSTSTETSLPTTATTTDSTVATLSTATTTDPITATSTTP
ncbi:MAG: hypothetical protein Q7R91_00500 [bacterium]|nr:hypothetical protein [bacterium]